MTDAKISDERLAELIVDEDLLWVAEAPEIQSALRELETLRRRVPEGYVVVPKQALAFLAKGSLLDIALDGASKALPVLFGILGNFNLLEGAAVADEVNANIKTANKELAHVRDLISAAPEVAP